MRVKTPFILVEGLDRQIAVRYLPVGARYGRGNVLTVEREPQVEFWDTSLADDGDPDALEGFGPLGQFTGGRYYVSTILEGQGGLCLHGGVREWDVPAPSMLRARAWLEEVSA